MNFPRIVSSLVAVVVLSGCAGQKVREQPSASELRQRACGLGEATQEVKGSVWMNAKSADSSGQFPAEVMVTPGSLRMEVTNLVGGREALITVDGARYSIEREGKVQKGRKSWGGIPLRWANVLFLGRVPCPELSTRGVDSEKLQLTPEGELVIETINQERFIYRFRSWAGAPWPEFVRWESGARSDKALAVEFEFSEPEDKTGAAKIWSAKSAQGEVKVRWKDRETR